MAGQWTQMSVETSASFRGLSAIGGMVMWASGTNGTVIRTTDGGEHWDVRIVEGAEKLDFRGVVAFDGENAVVMSSGNAEEGLARIYTTQDGGKNWKLAFENKTKGVFLDGMAFWDREHGIVLSDPVDGKFVLFATSDGGQNWKRIVPEKMPAALPQEGSFAASNSSLVVQGGNDVWFATGGAGTGRVFHSADRGVSWTVAESAIFAKSASMGIFSLAFEDEKHGVAVGGDYAHPGEVSGTNVNVTSDGGVTWQGMTAGNVPNVYFSSVTYKLAKHCDGPVGLLAGGTQGIYEVETGGTARQVSEFNVNVVMQPEAGIVWAVGAKGMVVVRRDLGE